MPVVYSTTVKNTRLTAVRDAIDGGSSNGTLEIGTTSMGTVLAVIPLADPCGSVSSGVLTFSMPQSDTNADASGTAAEARIKDSSGTVIVSGLTVGTSGANINLSSVGITAGDTVTLSSATITHG
jgi:hypothetical protein